MIKLEKGDTLQVWRDQLNRIVEFTNHIDEYKSHFESLDEDVPFDSQYFKELMEFVKAKYLEDKAALDEYIKQSIRHYFKKHVPDNLIALNLLCQEYK